MLSCEFSQIFKNIFFIEQVAASGQRSDYLLLRWEHKLGRITEK